MNRKQKRVLKQIITFLYDIIKYTSLAIFFVVCLVGLMLAYIYGMKLFIEEGKLDVALALSKLLRYGIYGAGVYSLLIGIEFMAKNGVCKRQKNI